MQGERCGGGLACTLFESIQLTIVRKLQFPFSDYFALSVLYSFSFDPLLLWVPVGYTEMWLYTFVIILKA